MSFNSFDNRSTRDISDTVVNVRNVPRTLQTLYQRQRHFWGAAGKPQQRGRPQAEIAGGADGVLLLYSSSGATGETVEVTNPYEITLPVELFCRVHQVAGWEKPFAVPDEFTACEAGLLPPDNVAPIVGS